MFCVETKKNILNINDTSPLTNILKIIGMVRESKINEKFEIIKALYEQVNIVCHIYTQNIYYLSVSYLKQKCYLRRKFVKKNK